MFEVNNGVAKIDGSRGKYDGGKYESKVSDPSVRYGRNAVENYYTYVEHPIVTDKMTPAPILDFGLNPDAAEKNADKLERFLRENDEYLKALRPMSF